MLNVNPILKELKHIKLFLLEIMFLLVPLANASPLPSWVDKETGHRIFQISSQPYSITPYFTVNAFSADNKSFFYTSPHGIHRVDLHTFASEIIVRGNDRNLWFVAASRKLARIYFLSQNRNSTTSRFEYLDLENGGEPTLIATIPAGFRIESVNSDDTLAAGVFEENVEKNREKAYKSKAEKLYGRAQESRPSTLFTINIGSSEIKNIYSSLEWLSHPQFSPVDANVLMYSIEGPWHLVDRIWLINSDGTNRKLVHRRSMEMEIAGHEFWSANGQQIIYDLQKPKGKAFYLATHEIHSDKNKNYPLPASNWSVHYNASSNPNLFVGDGADKYQVAQSDKGAFLKLYKIIGHDEANEKLSEAGSFQITELVDMQEHDYRLEPNARISPKNDLVIFRSNMFGPPQIFAVETKKSINSHDQIFTPEISRKKKQDYKRLLIKE